MRSMETLSLRIVQIGGKCRFWWRIFLRTASEDCRVNYLGFLAADDAA